MARKTLLPNELSLDRIAWPVKWDVGYVHKMNLGSLQKETKKKKKNSVLDHFAE